MAATSHRRHISWRSRFVAVDRVDSYSDRVDSYSDRVASSCSASRTYT